MNWHSEDCKYWPLTDGTLHVEEGSRKTKKHNHNDPAFVSYVAFRFQTMAAVGRALKAASRYIVGWSKHMAHGHVLF